MDGWTAMSLLEGYSACTMRVRSEGEGELRSPVNSAYSYSAVVDVEDWRSFCAVQYSTTGKLLLRRVLSMCGTITPWYVPLYAVLCDEMPALLQCWGGGGGIAEIMIGCSTVHLYGIHDIFCYAIFHGESQRCSRPRMQAMHPPLFQ